jgi:hypothetical protein
MMYRYQASAPVIEAFCDHHSWRGGRARFLSRETQSSPHTGLNLFQYGGLILNISIASDDPANDRNPKQDAQFSSEYASIAKIKSKRI